MDLNATIQRLKNAEILCFPTKINKKDSVFVIFDHRKNDSIDNLFQILTFGPELFFYRGINSPLEISNIKKYGIDNPRRNYSHLSVDSYSKALEYGKTPLGQIICVYSSTDFTSVLQPNTKTYIESHPFKLTYQGEGHLSAIDPQDFHPGYDLVYGRAMVDKKTLSPKFLIFFADSDEQLIWLQDVLPVASISVTTDYS